MAHKSTSAPKSVRLMCLATHHKGGTIWMKHVVKSLALAWDMPWIGIWSERQITAVPNEGAAFLVNWNGYFPDAIWDQEDAAFFHVIRDPRDVLLSGCQYHHYAGVKGERFLHQPLPEYDGMTYQEKLNTIASYDEKLLFEMAGKHAQTVSEMRAWPTDHPNQITVHYEDLIQDTDAEHFKNALNVWKLDALRTAEAGAAFVDNSLFGGAAEKNARVAQHVQSTSTSRWMREMPRSVGAQYAKDFGDDLIALGYEKDTSWVDTLPETSTPFAIKGPNGSANVTFH